MTENFYRAFEERHYAPRERILQLRRQYLAFVEPLAKKMHGSPVFDIGCGRGEWLELMSETGFAAYGVDIEEGMLSDCVANGLNAKKADGVSEIREISSESQAVVSAFHVVEHISFDDLQKVCVEAFRVLKPGGLLILETPNPENIGVATNNFYLDPTHVRPIPPLLLSFVVEQAGFSRVKVIRLQEAPELVDAHNASIRDLLLGVSPDYAVVAQKQGDAEFEEAVNGVFGRDYGVSLELVVERWDRQWTELYADVQDMKRVIERARRAYHRLLLPWRLLRRMFKRRNKKAV